MSKWSCSVLAEFKEMPLSLLGPAQIIPIVYILKLNKSKVEGKIYTTILGENTKNVRIDGSIIPIVKYLAINLGHLNFKINAALFAPIETLSSKDIIRGYQSKSLIKLPIKEKDISNSLDLFLDPGNIYMTGQLIKFDGGASIW